jgi:peptidoglycan hydrolase CwlO-like protein
MIKFKNIFFLCNIFILVFITTYFFLWIHQSPVYAQFSNLPQGQSLSDLDSKRKDIQTQIKQLEGQLSQSKQKEGTLKSQLQYIDNQTQLTQLKIEDTEYQITKLEKEINDLGNYIDNLSTRVDSLTKVLLDRIVTTYKYSNYSPLDLIFSAHGFADLLERIKFIQVIQSNDKKVLYNLQATKSTYNDQQSDKKTRQDEQQKLQKDLEKYQTTLASQKNDKITLLRLTQNDEGKFQQLINQSKAELDSITRALSSIGASIGPKKKNQIIAAMGSSGCSSGPHLHFEVYKDAKVSGGAVVDIKTGKNIQFKYTDHLVNPNNYLDNGKLGPPLQGYPSETRITTEFGGSYILPGGFSTNFHTGLDIAPKSPEGTGRSVLAADNGIAYLTTSVCNQPPPGGSRLGRGVIIDHQNGIVTLYFHVL